jgi:hypothetical protein
MKTFRFITKTRKGQTAIELQPGQAEYYNDDGIWSIYDCEPADGEAFRVWIGADLESSRYAVDGTYPYFMRVDVPYSSEA